MNTKTSLIRDCNYYNGDGVGRDSPGALLDMLAEVASQTLHSEKNWIESVDSDEVASKNVGKPKSQGPMYTPAQLLSMPASQLVKQFSLFTSDELKRQYSYTCALIPECNKRYTSFASEGRARMSIKAHLAEHLANLKTNQEAYSTFIASPVKHRSTKIPAVNKKAKSQQPKKPIETPNKENTDEKSKSTNYLRKILSNELNFTEFEKQKTIAKLAKNNDVRVLEMKNESQQVDFQVLDDHTYFEHVKQDEEEVDNVTVKADLNEMMVNEAMTENIMLMVVENDKVHMKELPYIAQDISVAADEHEREIIYLPDTVSSSEDVYVKNMETSAPAKPKGKAKFIGTSEEEREMALALMDRIKRKGNPTGENLQCRICDPPRSFTAPTTLVSHYRSHAGIKPYECRICRAVFTRRHSLKYHMLIHQNQTRFTCADCGKKFRHPSHFREHRRRHTGEAPFACEDCGQSFKTRNTYKRHLKTRHGKVLTTNGELLHLSEEDFQKVRTNPKRKPEVNPLRETIMDEDLTATDALIQFQAEDAVANGTETENGYSGIGSREKDDGNGNSELWGGEDVGDYELKTTSYDDYEYFGESGVNKTDYIETEMDLGNCKFENVDIDVNHLGYEEMVIENMNDDENAVRIFRGDEEDNIFVASEDPLVTQMNESEIEVSPYEECTGEESLREDHDILELQDVGVIEAEAEVERFHGYDDGPSTNEIATSAQSEEENASIVEFEPSNETESSTSPKATSYALEEEAITSTEFSTPDDFAASRSPGTDYFLADQRERVEESEIESVNATTIEEPAQPRFDDESCPRVDATPRVYLGTSGANGIVIKNKDLMDLLTRRIKLQDNLGRPISANPKVITLPNQSAQPFSFGTNNKQGTILLLSSNELTNNFLKIDAKGLKALPVIAVQQK